MKKEGAGAYRFGFNGKENDNEVKGIGNQQDYGMRIYDPRIGRFLSVDPLTKNYPWYTPYSFAGNKPIWAIDVDGAEEYIKTFKYEDGKATLLRIVQNSEIQIRFTSNSEKNGQTPFVREIIDKRTGKLMNPAEIGQVQHQYVDSKGTKLNIRRNYGGSYVPGDNETMPLGSNNYLGSIYIGPDNPTYKDVNGKTQYDYRREPQDEVDAAAMQHDIDYDKARAAGAGDAFFNKDVIPADKKLVTAANQVKEKAKTAGIDNVTGKPVSSGTARRASVVSKFFSWILKAPAFKGEIPKSNEKPGPHVIK